MSKEVKISMPLFDKEELKKIDTSYNDIADEYIKQILDKREQVLSQRLMKKLREENKHLKSNWKALKEWANHIPKQIHYIDKATIINKLNELESNKE